MSTTSLVLMLRRTLQRLVMNNQQLAGGARWQAYVLNVEATAAQHSLFSPSPWYASSGGSQAGLLSFLPYPQARCHRSGAAVASLPT